MSKNAGNFWIMRGPRGQLVGVGMDKWDAWSHFAYSRQGERYSDTASAEEAGYTFEHLTLKSVDKEKK